MKEECLICKAPLEYLENDELMECAICSKTRCVHGHYVCNDCHTAGLDTIIGLCLAETSRNPVEIIEKMMSQPFCHMHGPEHHVMVGAALLTAYKNAGGELNLPMALNEIMSRGKSVPGGACGFWGACGAGISTGMFVSIISKSTPLANEPFALSHQMTAKSLGEIGHIGGSRCCKRDSFHPCCRRFRQGTFRRSDGTPRDYLPLFEQEQPVYRSALPLFSCKPLTAAYVHFP